MPEKVLIVLSARPSTKDSVVVSAWFRVLTSMILSATPATTDGEP